MLLLGLSKNPLVTNLLIRWAFIGFSLVEVSGFIGLVFAFLFLYALKSNANYLIAVIKRLYLINLIYAKNKLWFFMGFIYVS